MLIHTIQLIGYDQKRVRCLPWISDGSHPPLSMVHLFIIISSRTVIDPVGHVGHQWVDVVAEGFVL